MCQPFGWVPVSFTSGGPYGPRGVFLDFEGGSPRCILGQTPCSLNLRPKGRAETLQLKYSCQLLAVYIQYKHIDYTDIRQIKYKHIHILQIVVTKKYCVKYKVLDIRCWHLENTFLLNLYSVIEYILPIIGGYMSFGGFLSRGPTVRGPTVRGPNCPGPNCPFCQGGQLGPGQLGPGAQLSTFSRWTVGPRGPAVRGPTVHFFKADIRAPDSWAPGPNCPGPNCPFFEGGQLGPGQLGPGAQLSGAQLSGAQLSGAQLSGAQNA